MVEILEVIAWPVTVIVVVVILRTPLSDLVSKTKRVKFKELDIEFKDEIRKIEAEAERALPEPNPDLQKGVSVDLYELSHIAPNAAVSVAWRAIENSAKELIKAKGIQVDYDVSTPYKLIQSVLIDENLIDDQRGRIYQQLRRLRNKVVHAEGYVVSEEQAEEYVALSLKLRTYLESLA